MGVGVVGQSFVHCAAIMFEGMEVLFCGEGRNGVSSLCDGEGLRWPCGIVDDDIGGCIIIGVEV